MSISFEEKEKREELDFNLSHGIEFISKEEVLKELNTIMKDYEFVFEELKDK